MSMDPGRDDDVLQLEVHCRLQGLDAIKHALLFDPAATVVVVAAATEAVDVGQLLCLVTVTLN
jgi:hypothetical protein